MPSVCIGKLVAERVLVWSVVTTRTATLFTIGSGHRKTTGSETPAHSQHKIAEFSLVKQLLFKHEL